MCPLHELPSTVETPRNPEKKQTASAGLYGRLASQNGPSVLYVLGRLISPVTYTIFPIFCTVRVPVAPLSRLTFWMLFVFCLKNVYQRALS